MTTPTSTTNNQSALDFMKQTLADWGLSDLYSSAAGFIQQGMGTDEVEINLQNTQEYKTRFAGNAERIANGLRVLSPADYLSAEAGYKSVLQSYGLPAGFYDQHSDFNDFIGKDISPAELQTRAKVAADQYVNAPSYVKDLWGQYYGTSGDAIASILDPTVATNVIQNRGTQVAIGGAAAFQGLGVDQARAQQLQQGGVSAQQAQQGYQQIAQSMPTDQAIANRFGTSFDQEAEENDVLLGQAAAHQQRATLYGEEKGLFSGHGAMTHDSLSQSQAH